MSHSGVSGLGFYFRILRGTFGKHFMNCCVAPMFQLKKASILHWWSCWKTWPSIPQTENPYGSECVQCPCVSTYFPLLFSKQGAGKYWAKEVTGIAGVQSCFSVNMYLFLTGVETQCCSCLSILALGIQNWWPLQEMSPCSRHSVHSQKRWIQFSV